MNTDTNNVAVAGLPGFPGTEFPSPFLAEYRRSFLGGDGETQDAILRITMELAAELWVAKERLRILEQKLTESGTLEEDAIEKTRITPNVGANRKRRTEFVDNIFRHLLLSDVDDAMSVVSPEDFQTPMHGAFKQKVEQD